MAVNCPTNASSLLYDTACLHVHNDLDKTVNLYYVSSDCIQCDDAYWTTVPLQSSLSLVVSAVHSINFTAKDFVGKTVCRQAVSFSQHEVVSWDIKNCIFTIHEIGDDAFTPLYVLVVGVISLLLLLSACRSLYHSRWVKDLFTRNPVIIDMQNDLGNPSSSSDSLPLVQSELVPLRRLNSPRIKALDTFRGLTIVLMIFVNYGGGKYWFFEHSAWNGITVADIVFPWFAWVMGVSLVISYRSKLRSCVSRFAVLFVSHERTLILVTLGLVINMYNNNDLATARYCGVLQRLGLAHLVISTLEILFMKKQPSFQHGKWLYFSELLDCWRQWLIVLLLVSVQVYVTLCLPVPGCPTGYLGPGGIGNHSVAPNCTGGAARYIDSMLFGDNHLYRFAPVKKVYHTTVPFDPEGFLGLLTTCLTVYLGVQTGYIILSYNTTGARTTCWIFWAILTGVLAGVLCNWSQEGGLIPVNKQLWSLSFALLTSSAGFLLFTVLFLIVDHCQWWSGYPFRYAGMNAILLYIGHIVTRHTFPWSWKPHDLTTHTELLSMNVGAVFLWLLIAKVLHRNEIFLTI